MTDYTIFECCKRNDVEGLRRLIDEGADINIKDKNGEYPLHFASRYNSIDCLRLLIEAGADVTIQNNKRETFLEHIQDAHVKKEIEEYVHKMSSLDIKEPDF